MSNPSEAPFEQFWAALLRGEHPSQAHAFDEFASRLTTFARATRDASAHAAALQQGVLEAFSTFAERTLRPPPVATGTPGDAAVRFAAASAQLQASLARVSAAACTDIQAQCAESAPRSLQELFDRWVACYEEHLFEQLTDARFGEAFGQAVNAALECYRDARRPAP